MRRRKTTPKPWIKPLPRVPPKQKALYKSLRDSLGTEGRALVDTLCWIHDKQYTLAALDGMHGFTDIRKTHEELRVRQLVLADKTGEYFALQSGVAVLARHAQKEQAPLSLLRCLSWIDDLFVGTIIRAPQEHRIFFGNAAQNVAHYAWLREIPVPTGRIFRLVGAMLKAQGETETSAMFEERARKLFRDAFAVIRPAPEYRPPADD